MLYNIIMILNNDIKLYITENIEKIINENIIDDLPFYIINFNEIIKKYNNWKDKLPNIQPYYAIKCNSDKNILLLLLSLGCKFDTASQFEMNEILNICNDPNKIIFANPCKFISHIKYAKDNNINLMTFDNEEELYKIQQYHPFCDLILRLAVDDSKSLCKFNIKFGCKENNIEKLILLTKKLGLNLKGFSFHVGSGCNCPNIYYDAIKICKNAYDIAIKNNIKINIIDIGGGFQSNNFDEISEYVIKAQTDFFINELNDITFIAEPGRYLVETSHTLVLNVISKKIEDDLYIYYLNEGMYGSFNCITNDHAMPSFNILNNNNNKIRKSRFFGPTCDSIDLIYNEIYINELNIGDYIYIKNMGAYTISGASPFNGFKLKNKIYINII